LAISLSPINQLIDNITESVAGLVADITGQASGGLPAIPTSKEVMAVLSTVDASNWLKLSFPYTFSVVNIDGTGQNPFTDFSLPISPGSLKQTEDFAVSIKATQGGTTTTHSGNRYKTLSIKGTTGIAPNRGDGGVNKKTGEAIFQPKALRNRSGYEVFLRLRNWFRAYHEYKASAGKEAKGLRLVFKNYKDGEFLIVELEKFDMDRQAARSFLYDYELEFKVIAHLSFQELINRTTGFEDALSTAVQAIDTARGVFLRSQGILRQVESTYESVVVEPLRKTSLAIKALLGIPTVAGDMGSKAIRNTVSEASTLAILLGLASQQKDNKTTGTLDTRLAQAALPTDLKAAAKLQGSSAITNLGEALMAMDPSSFPEQTQNALAQELIDSQKLPRSFYDQTLEELERVKQNAEDFFNLGDAEYDSLFNRTATLSAPFTKIPTAAELDVLNAFNDAMMAIMLLLSTEDLFKSTYDARIQDMNARFGGNLDLIAENAVRQVTYNAGSSLERIAQDEMGDSTRWGEIAEVNGLKAPYVSDDAGDTRKNILKPGTKFMIPTPARNGFSQVPAGKDGKTTVGLSELEKSLGTDLKLTKDFDLSISNSGDLEVVSGVQNMAQAVLLKLSYEKGEVMRYPEMGAGLRPGVKFPPIEAIKDGLTNTLLQDTRIEGIQDLSIVRDGPAAYLAFNLKIKMIDIPVPIKIKV
jgi:nucleoid-associated protein YgaU